MQTANTIWGAVFTVVHFLGMAAIGYWLLLRLLRVRRDERFAVILPLDRAAGASDSVYAMYLRLQWTHELAQGAVIALDTGLPESSKKEVERFCRTLKNVYFCSPDELADVLEKLQEDT